MLFKDGKSASALRVEQSRYTGSQSFDQQKDSLGATTTKLTRRSSSKGGSTRVLRSDAGDDLDDATYIGKLKGGRELARYGEVDDDDADYFRFKFKKADDLSLRLTNKDDGDDDSIFGAILDEDGDLVASKRFKPDKTKGLKIRDLESGVYYLRLTTNGDNVDYEFRLSAE
jgi:hypothetical protein